LAILQLASSPDSFKPLNLRISDAPVGTEVIAIGTPNQLGLQNTLTTGVVSGLRTEKIGKSYQNYSREVYQTNAAINPGNSGGPLIDEKGLVIGINTFIIRGNNEGLNFAVHAKHLAALLMKANISASNFGRRYKKQVKHIHQTKDLPTGSYDKLKHALQKEALKKRKVVVQADVKNDMNTTPKTVSPSNKRPLRYIFNAIDRGDISTVRNEIKLGTGINSRYQGYTLLMYAAIKGKSEVVNLLLSLGASSLKTRLDGKTALMFAAIYKEEAAVKALLSTKNDAYVRDNQGRTALMYAAQSGSLGIIKLLILSGSNLALKDNMGNTAEALADIYQHQDISVYLYKVRLGY
ncbi:MAG: ankyrin repeat domain-containing protein, partial [Mariprofundaceae bacterium]|nr:ankyrin repeat domain-containing protein [Mariprofundaceae bacterium]